MRTTKDLSLKDTAPFVLLEFSVSRWKKRYEPSMYIDTPWSLGTTSSHHIQCRHGHVDHQLLSQKRSKG